MAAKVKHEIKLTGMGGQGIILCGYMIGKAASLFGDSFSTMTQAFGPEARGSACSSQVIISPEPIEYPYIRKPDMLMAMSQDAFNQSIGELSDDGMILYDSDFVNPGKLKGTQKAYGIPATRIAEQAGRKIVANVVMMGFLTAVTEVVTPKAMKKAVIDSVPPGTGDFSLKLFQEGYNFGLKTVRSEVDGDGSPVKEKGRKGRRVQSK